MAHRSYDPITPGASKLLSKKWDETRYQAHRKALRSVKPAIDSGAPPTYVHMHIKMKKLQLEEERLSQIQHDNRLLLEKMSYIMRGNSRVDHLNDYSHKSLNKEKRQRDLLTITQENQDILKRIQAKQPAYNVDGWRTDYKKSQGFKAAITRFPDGASPTKHHKDNLDDTTFGEDDEEHHDDHSTSRKVEGSHNDESSTDPGAKVDRHLEEESETDPSGVGVEHSQA